MKLQVEFIHSTNTNEIVRTAYIRFKLLLVHTQLDESHFSTNWK